MQSQPPSLRLAIFADDLTGAADSGAPFARLGFSTVVALDIADTAAGPADDVDVLVVNTDSRYRRTSEAAASVTAGGQAVKSLGFSLVYKKIDSLFRGNVGAEIAAAMDALGVSECLLAPAFPAQGRTTEEGRCLVRGKPLPTPEIADILRNNAPGAFDVTLLGPKDFAGTLPFPGRPAGTRRVLLVDAWKQEHLENLASQFFDGPASENPVLLAGSGGFAAAIATVMARTGRQKAPRSAGEAPLAPADSAAHRGILIVSGSRSDEATRQLEELRSATGAPVVTPLDPPEEAVAGVRKAQAALAGGKIAVVATDPGPTITGASGRVAAIAEETLSSGLRPRLLFVGGETAMATLRLLGATRMVLFGELEPGVAFGRLPGSRYGTLEIATKAGAFGDPGTLLRLVKGLSLLT